ncbi:centrosomal protein of 89 kDa [Fopius arisanus]|uniref:Centrosomal protein of 89 kDa n=1 Tax=Fopius arisanus TaxID=64838 RepID=A0A9R1T9Q9_9HYME|nr:PREDICTED: centrosomal protein of 89 kDa [Fopius arisanus]
MMSYFYGTPINSLEQSTSSKSDKKKHKRRVEKGYELEPVHGSRHRRKHSSRSRCTLKSKGAVKLISDNEKMIAKLQSTPESGFMDELSEKENQLSKCKSRYLKLEKSFQTIELENANLQEALAKNEKDYNKLQSHYEELMKQVQCLGNERTTLVNGYKKIKSENNQMDEDISLLKMLIYKLNVELERYQDRLRSSQVQDDSRSSRVEDSDPGSESRRVAEAWGRVNTHVLAPLLEAYQENLREKDELITQYRHEMDEFSGRCKEIVGENEILRKEIEHYKAEIDKLALDMKTIEENASTIKEENDILTKQASLQKQKLHEIHSIYEKKVESMSQDNNQLHATYIACKTELSNVQGKYEILNEAFEKLKKNSEKTMPVSVHSEAIEECKRLFEELKSQYETEKRKLLGQLKRFEETTPDNEKMLAVVTAERDQLKLLARNLEKNLKRSQYKLESIQSSVCSIQVSRDSFKRQLAKTTAYCDELVGEQERLVSERNELLYLLQEREKENKNIQIMGDNIAQRMNTLKSQLKIVQKGAKEQLDTVEKQMKSQEVGVGRIKSDYHQELHRLKQLLKQKEDVIGKLQREKSATQNNLELVWKTATSEDKRVKDALKNKKT